jgi:fumarate reductase flavoprotein subunit
LRRIFLMVAEKKAKGSGKLITSNSNQKCRVGEKRYSFEIPPAPIPANTIKEIINTDIVVAGAGPAGLAAAVSAAEKGARVTVLEKYHKIGAPGGPGGAFINSALQQEKGIKVDKEDIIRKLSAISEGRADERFLRMWADKNTEVADWLVDMAEAAGIYVHTWGNSLMLRSTRQGEPVDMWKDELLLLNMLADEGRRKGVDIRCSTPAVRLIRPEKKGKVRGIIARNADGDYIRFNTSKAVILCTGDYSMDEEMLEKYCPWAGHTPKMMLETETGDGHKMGLWIGAAIEDAPHCPIVLFKSTNEIPVRFFRPLGEWEDQGNYLYVNKFGERFANESIPMEYLANIVLRQPNKTYWQVFDEKCITDHHRSDVEKCLKSGAVLKADTIEELGPRFGASGRVFKATVDRYNEMVRLGKDLDFGKDSRLMINSIDKPPFYVCESPPDLLGVMGGFKRNLRGQVLDANREAIPGLYAAGNIAGGFCGDSYPISVLHAICRSHALTFGRLTGQNAADCQAE